MQLKPRLSAQLPIQALLQNHEASGPQTTAESARTPPSTPHHPHTPLSTPHCSHPTTHTHHLHTPLSTATTHTHHHPHPLPTGRTRSPRKQQEDQACVGCAVRGGAGRGRETGGRRKGTGNGPPHAPAQQTGREDLSACLDRIYQVPGILTHTLPSPPKGCCNAVR